MNTKKYKTINSCCGGLVNNQSIRIELHLDHVDNYEMFEIICEYISTGIICVKNVDLKAKLIMSKYNIINEVEFSKKSEKYIPRLILKSIGHSKNEYVSESSSLGILEYTVEPNDDAVYNSNSLFCCANTPVKFNGHIVSKIANINTFDLRESNKVFIGINEPTKGGIMSVIEDYITAYRAMGIAEVNFITGDFSHLPTNLLYDYESMDFDNIYILSEVDDFSSIISSDSILHFTQISIAKAFIPFYEDNIVIFQYHRNVDDIQKIVENDIISLNNWIKKGEIQFLDTDEHIEKLYPQISMKNTFRNYSFDKIDEVKEVKEIKNIAYVGRLSADKNIEGLVKIINKVHEVDENIIFNIYGTGVLEEYLVNNTSSNVFIKGYESVKSKIYESNDVSIMPSLFEAFSVSVAESLMYGRKVITFEHSRLINEIINTDSGVIVKDVNYDLFASKILELKPYDSNKVVDVYNKLIYSNLNTDLNYYVTKRAFSWVFVPKICLYKSKFDGQNIILSFCVNNDIKLKDKLNIRASFKYEIIENNDHLYYDFLSHNHKENFMDIKISIDDLINEDQIYFFYGNKKCNFVLVNNVPSKLIFNDLTLNTIDSAMTFKTEVEKPKKRILIYSKNSNQNNLVNKYQKTIQQNENNIVEVVDLNNLDFTKKQYINQIVFEKSLAHINTAINSKLILTDDPYIENYANVHRKDVNLNVTENVKWIINYDQRVLVPYHFNSFKCQVKSAVTNDKIIYEAFKKQSDFHIEYIDLEEKINISNNILIVLGENIELFDELFMNIKASHNFNYDIVITEASYVEYFQKHNKVDKVFCTDQFNYSETSKNYKYIFSVTDKNINHFHHANYSLIKKCDYETYKKEFFLGDNHNLDVCDTVEKLNKKIRGFNV
jgi:glycosyltransferase involved in cell wall biosynthesis